MDEEAEAKPKPNKLKAFLPYIGILLVGLGGGYGASLALAPPPEDSEEGEEADEGGASAEGHGEAKADAHGEPKADAHGEAKADGHGEAKVDAHGEPKADAHGAPADAHGAPAAGHGAPAAAEASSHLAAGLTGGSLVTNLGTFTINLRGSGGGRVVRMEVQLDSDAPTGTTVKERTPQLRDSIISAVSDYTWSELEGVDGKTRLREELLARVNGVVTPGAVDRLYFTQFVVQ